LNFKFSFKRVEDLNVKSSSKRSVVERIIIADAADMMRQGNVMLLNTLRQIRPKWRQQMFFT